MMPKKKPTIDQRLEAVTQTLELVAAMQQVNEKELSHLSKEVSHLTKLSKAIFTNQEVRIRRLEGRG